MSNPGNWIDYADIELTLKVQDEWGRRFREPACQFLVDEFGWDWVRHMREMHSVDLERLVTDLTNAVVSRQ